MKRLVIGLIALLYVLFAAFHFNSAQAQSKRTSQNTKPKTDSYGDPLPRGAVARLGSQRLRHSGAIRCIAFSPDSKSIASAGHDRKVRLWDSRTGELKFELDISAEAMTFSPDGRHLVTGDLRGDVVFWNVDTGKEIGRFLAKDQSAVKSTAFSPNGKVIALGTRWGFIELRDAANANLLRIIKTQSGEVLTLQFSPNGKLLVSVGRGSAETRIWDPQTGKLVRVLKKTDDSLLKASFAADGKTIASVGKDTPVRLWNVATGKEIMTIADTSTFVDISSDGSRILSKNKNDELAVFDRRTGKIYSTRSILIETRSVSE